MDPWDLLPFDVDNVLQVIKERNAKKTKKWSSKVHGSEGDTDSDSDQNKCILNILYGIDELMYVWQKLDLAHWMMISTACADLCLVECQCVCVKCQKYKKEM